MVERFGGLERDQTGTWRDTATGREVRVWQRFLSGRRLNLLDPSPFDFEDEDLALGLAREARWAGQTRGPWPYSVAQHSVDVLLLLRRICPAPLITRELQLAALVHDGSEGLGGAGDVITPLKTILGDGYRIIDRNLQRVVHAKYGLAEVVPDVTRKWIKKADRMLAATEAYQLAAYTLEEVRDPRVLGNPERPRTDIRLEPWSPEEARHRFLTHLLELKELPT